VAQAENATQLVMGATHRSRLNEFVRGSVINAVIRAAGGSLDVHVIATGTEREAVAEAAAADHPGDEAESARGKHRDRPPGRYQRGLLSPLSRRRRVAAVAIGIIGFPILTLVLTADPSIDSLATALSTYLVLVVAVAAVGGVWPAVLAALAGFLLSNYYFAPPIHTFTIADARDILALVMFLVTAGVVSVLVDLSARRTAAAVEARTDAHTLARIAGRMIAPEGNPLPALLQELVLAFRLEGAAVLRSTTEKMPSGTVSGTAESPPGSWSRVAAAGETPPLDPGQASMVLPLTDRELLALRGPGLAAEDQEILSAFAAQLAAALASDRLHSEAAEADALAKANQLRSALLAAVSHDLRTPLASIKAASSSLLSDQLAFGPEETRTLLTTVDDEADRLNSLVENLLDMSRIQTGSMDVLHQNVDIGELIGSALHSLGPRAEEVVVEVPAALPHIRTDPVLLERAVANLVDNALIHAGGTGLRVEAGTVAGRVDIRIIDRGPGIAPEDRDRIFQPFQRLGDSERRGSVGVGLGLAVARGFVEAVGGDLDIEDTPGGGLTMVVRLPVGASSGEVPPAPETTTSWPETAGSAPPGSAR
jgi:two-component system sensor histidine kinase KdpD